MCFALMGQLPGMGYKRFLERRESWYYHKHLIINSNLKLISGEYLNNFKGFAGIFHFEQMRTGITVIG